MTSRSSTRYSASNPVDPATQGYSRVVVPTALGDVVVHASPRTAEQSETATLLIHGAAGSWTTWLPLIRAAHNTGEPLHNVVALDLPGWGDSGSLPQGTTVDDMVDVVAHVARKLGFVKWHASGHSLGGHLALTLAASYPERTLSVTAISATGPGALAVLRHPIRSFRILPLLAGMLGAMRLLAAIGPAGEALIRVLHQLRLLGPLSSPLFAQLNKLDVSVIDSLASEIRPHAFVRAAEAAARYDEGQWSNIRCPVTLIRGERDAFVSPHDDAWFTEILPQVEQHASAHAGHFAHVESAGLHAPSLAETPVVA
ncbi:alpha/beta hydrolase [Rhodoglobus aureus]